MHELLTALLLSIKITMNIHCHNYANKKPKTCAAIVQLTVAQIPLGLSRHVTSRPTRHDRRVEPMHFGCVELVEQHNSTRSTRRTYRVVSRRDVTWRDEPSWSWAYDKMFRVFRVDGAAFGGQRLRSVIHCIVLEWNVDSVESSIRQTWKWASCSFRLLYFTNVNS